MKRSLAVTLVLMGAATAAGCSDTEVQTAVYSSAEECVSAGVYEPGKCGRDYAAAQKVHASTAPAYAKIEDCEAEFGAEKCQPAPQGHQGGTSSFVPFMMGYMLGGRSGDASVAPAALYRQQGAPGFVNSGGVKVSEGTGPVKLFSRSAAARPAAVSTKTLSRGGFGARSMSISA